MLEILVNVWRVLVWDICKNINFVGIKYVFNQVDICAYPILKQPILAYYFCEVYSQVVSKYLANCKLNIFPCLAKSICIVH